MENGLFGETDGRDVAAPAFLKGSASRKETSLSDKVFFVSGIDTGVGKSYATGFLAREWNRLGIRTISQKLVQTGNTGMSEDILLHRRIMGVPLLNEDRDGLTMPEVYSYPCSPHLAARIDGRPVDLTAIGQATRRLAACYDAILLEGAGGLMVPLREDLLTIDYLASESYPVILVTTGRLGSINHTLLSLEAIRTRGLRLHALVYNLIDQTKDRLVAEDAQAYLGRILKRFYPQASYVELPVLEKED